MRKNYPRKHNSLKKYLVKTINPKLNHSTIWIITLVLLNMEFIQGQVPPLLNFSDITNGPSNGLNDNLGQGALVTLWGQHLGDAHGDSKIMFKDSSGKEQEMAHIYYWKKADGILPGGPADLYSSHGMQEIAVSIPEAPMGEGEIFVIVNGQQSNSLPFTVREGNIYHVMTSGDNVNGDGSFDNPWRDVNQDNNGAFKKIKGGELIYVHDGVQDISTQSEGKSARGIYMSGKEAPLNGQTGLIAYPNSRVLAQSRNRGIAFFKASGIVISKYIAKAGNFPKPPEGSDEILGGAGNVAFGIQANKNGRLIGNFITGIENTCQEGGAGAIVGGGTAMSNCKMFGNQIRDWGCDQTSKFEHTTYFSIRESGLEVEPYEFAWNFLLDNKAKYGIHQYDEDFSTDCGVFIGTVRIHNNVVVNQRGAGLSIGASESASGNGDGICWNNDWEIYNNVFINNGLGPVDWPKTGDGIAAAAVAINDTSLGGSIFFYHNLIYTFGLGDENYPDQGTHSAIQMTWGRPYLDFYIENNIFFNTSSATVSYYNSGRDRNNSVFIPDNNLYFDEAGIGLSPPEFEPQALTENPLLIKEGWFFQIGDMASPLIIYGSSTNMTHDIYGNPRIDGMSDIGPFEFTDGFVPPDIVMPGPTPEPEPTSEVIYVSPNPTHGLVNINMGLKQIGEVQLYDATGKRVAKYAENNIDMASLASGLYYMVIISSDLTIATKRVIKK